ncbi:MAG: HupE/UreJ family protein [Paracoccaceae bacterium]|jgi:hydrogenase/urease accessory protein HupE|nr:HupE/UreJ family protein [Paracoccaceae bacterium]
MIRAALILALLAALLPGRAAAHALEPGYLELIHFSGTEWRATWRKPQVQGQPMAIDAVLPEGCMSRRGPAPAFDGRAFVAGWVADCPEGLGGGTIAIEGLEATRTDVLVRYTLAGEAAPQTRRLTPDAPAFAVPPPQGPLARFADYFRLGVDHILSGLDHLLFVFALLLLIRRAGPLLAAITSFTVAHSVSLGLATFGWIVVPAPPVEAVVALSIVVLAAELAQPPGQGLRLTERFPWTVAFLFGLLHGLGFARALLELGLPEGDVPLALLAFNLGVEAGQLMFIAAVLAAGLFLARLLRGGAPLLAPGSPSLRLTAYAIGTLASIWMIDRVAGFAT